MIQKSICFLIILLINNTIQAQLYTTIPDRNFENALEALGYDDITNDGKVPTANINTVERLVLNAKNIADFSGIEDFNSLKVLIVINNPLTIFDISNNTALTHIQLNLNNLTTIDLSANVNLVHLDLSFNKLTSINLTPNTNLETLYIHDNLLTEINLSTNLTLINLEIEKNSLTEINLSTNTDLETLYIHDNLLTSLDVSHNSSISILDTRNNKLTSLNLKNGNNIAISQMHTSNNPDLNCITVDNENEAMDNSGIYASWILDNNARYSEDCNEDVRIKYILVPDENLEDELKDYDNKRLVKDGLIPRANIVAITELDISNSDIEDLTGIQEFIALEKLDCSDNKITSLPKEQLPENLKELNVSDNDLTNLSLSDFNSLSILNCSSNSIESLILNDLNEFKELDCDGNNLQSLDLSKLTTLEALNVSRNELDALDISNNKNLIRFIAIGTNNYQHLDFSKNPNVQSLIVSSSNSIKSLNIKNGSIDNPTSVSVLNNTELECIEVDNLNDAINEIGKYENWFVADGEYSENCNNTLNTSDFNNRLSFTVSPVPSNGIINISEDLDLSEINIYNNLGVSVLYKKTEEKTINLSGLSKGVYYLSIKSKNKTGIKKIVLH